MAGKKPGGGEAMLLRLAVCTATGVTPAAGAAVLMAEASEPLCCALVLLERIVHMRVKKRRYELTKLLILMHSWTLM